MDDYHKLVEQELISVKDIFPWDLADEIKQNPDLVLLDVRELDEFEMMHIKNSIHVPRGVLESACCWNYDETVPLLASSREQNIVVICRSGLRSALAVLTMQQMGFSNVRSLKIGTKGWNDNDLEMVDIYDNIVDIDHADSWLNKTVAAEKLDPNL